jgi:hypothetical protein
MDDVIAVRASPSGHDTPGRATASAPVPRFATMVARHSTVCGGCAARMPVGATITYDRSERTTYHPGCAQVAIQDAPWLIAVPAADAPPSGQIFTHPTYGHLACIRLTARQWYPTDAAALELCGVAARRALPEEVETARWRATRGDEETAWWLDAYNVGGLTAYVAELTGWAITRLAREPDHFAVPHSNGLIVFCQAASVEESEAAVESDPVARQLYATGYRWCRCFSTASTGGEYGHVHMSVVVPMSAVQFDDARRREWDVVGGHQAE